ncbi:MAG: hypothetical protein EXR07_04870 [Acetobacteraceae bacterium]|nr:hypothetical protein [Acetobacteraceae bacterium]
MANRPANVHVLIRSSQPRVLAEGGCLPAYCAALPEQARETIDVPAKGKHSPRKAAVAPRFGPATLVRPEKTPDKDEARTVPLWVVDVQEIDPPNGAEPVHWRLLTTYAVITVDQARQIVAWYRMRWIIEQVFRSMKADRLRAGNSRVLHQTGNDRSDRGGQIDAACHGPGRKHRPAGHRCRRPRRHAGPACHQRQTRGSYGKAQEPAR